MFDYIFGLPMHVLVIHGIVVLVPLVPSLPSRSRCCPDGVRSCVGRLRSALSSAPWGPGWRRRAVRRCSSGCRRCAAPTTDFDLVRNHTDAGYRVRLVATIFLVVVLAACWLLKPSARDDVGAARSSSWWPARRGCLRGPHIVAVVLAGHAGSAAVWSDLG